MWTESRWGLALRRAAAFLTLICLVGHVGLVPLGPAAARADTPDPAARLERGKQLYVDGDLEQALVELAAAAASDGPLEVRRDASLYLGIVLLNLGRTEDADISFGQALSLDPDLELDPAEHPPQVITAFERLRRRLREGGAVQRVVTINPPGVYLAPPARERSTAVRPWYKKWWVWALAGVAVAAVVGRSRKSSSPAKPLAVDASVQIQGVACDLDARAPSSLSESCDIAPGEEQQITLRRGTTLDVVLELTATGGVQPYESSFEIHSPAGLSHLFECPSTAAGEPCRLEETLTIDALTDFGTYTITAIVTDTASETVEAVMTLRIRRF